MKNFVVTGSTKGIGFSIVSEILEKYDDAFVFMSYAHDDKSAEMCKNLWKGKVCVSKVDLSSYSEMKEYCSFLKNKIDSIFALVLNAGIGYKAPFEELDIEEFEKVMRVNVNVPIFMITSVRIKSQKR